MKYLITLKPLKHFFFGSEQTFGEGEAQNYFAKSALFPQQSAVLGMLKKEMLKKERLITRKIKDEWGEDKEAIEEIIGKGKFAIDTTEDLDYGKIKSISEVILYRDDEFFWVMKDIFDLDIEFDDEALVRFNPKERIKDILVSNMGNINKNLPFKSKIEVGNKKKSDEDGFFKKEVFCLKNNFCFAFFVNGNYDFLKLDGSFVKLGADDSRFLMSVKEFNDEVSPKVTLNKNIKNTYVLLSDAYIPDIKDIVDFGITDEVTFKFLSKNNKKGVKKSKLYHFYKRGSILFNLKDESKIAQYKSLTQIGYNKLKRIEK
jgi:CRISPR-associated protein Cmr3